MDWFKRVLVVVAHSDDEVLLCGGLAARLKRLRDEDPAAAGEMHMLVLSRRERDEKLRHDTPAGGAQEPRYEQYSGAIRSKELAAAADALGFSYHVAAFPLHQLDTVPQEELVAVVEAGVRQYRPTAVLTLPAGYDQDHRAVYHAVRAACRPHAYPGTVLMGETQLGQIVPNLFVALDTNDLVAKRKAFELYVTQRAVPQHLFSGAAIVDLAAVRGREVFRTYAEAYEVVRGVVA